LAISLFAAILIAVSPGISAARRRCLGQVILGVVGIAQTVPALALLVFMIPLRRWAYPLTIACAWLKRL
jgi:osmoprotectant transport system permease protein